MCSIFVFKIPRPPRSTPIYSSAASDVYKGQDFSKGFALVPLTSGINANALMSFAMSDTATQLRLYYRYSKDGKADTTFKNFIFNNGIPGASANQIVRNYTGSEAPVHLGTKPRGHSLIYLQAAPVT